TRIGGACCGSVDGVARANAYVRSWLLLTVPSVAVRRSVTRSDGAPGDIETSNQPVSTPVCGVPSGSVHAASTPPVAISANNRAVGPVLACTVTVSARPEPLGPPRLTTEPL